MLLLVGAASTGQSTNLSPAPGASQDKTAPPSAPAPETSNVQDTLAAAHQKLEKGNPQEAITMLEGLVATRKGSARGVQHELGITYYRTSCATGYCL